MTALPSCRLAVWFGEPVRVRCPQVTAGHRHSKAARPLPPTRRSDARRALQCVPLLPLSRDRRAAVSADWARSLELVRFGVTDRELCLNRVALSAAGGLRCARNASALRADVTLTRIGQCRLSAHGNAAPMNDCGGNTLLPGALIYRGCPRRAKPGSEPTQSARSQHLCLRNELLPMSPE